MANEQEYIDALARWQPGEACQFLYRDLDKDGNEDEGVKELDAKWFEQHPSRNVFIRRPIDDERDARVPKATLDQVVVVRRCKEHNNHRVHYIVVGKFVWQTLRTDEQVEEAIAMFGMTPGAWWTKTGGYLRAF